MAISLKELLAQKEALEANIAELRAAEVSEAKAKIQALIAEHELTQEDIFPGKSSSKPRKSATTKVAAKYRDPASGKVWSGRGLPPKWVAGQDKSKFLIA